MFSTQIPSKRKNLKGVYFVEKESVEKIIDALEISANDPYAASLPLIASAALGDNKRYAIANTKMLKALTLLEENPDSAPQWMRNNSFKAWMWGRILLAADNMGDVKIIAQAKNKLALLLEETMTQGDSLSFFAWAWGYRAALDSTEYKISNERMIQDAMQLTKKYKEESGENNGALSDALWAWVMALSAVSNAGDEQKYALIKEQIKLLTKSDSITKALERGLLRTSKSNDYPAWALAKIRFAAAAMKDNDLYLETEKSLVSSMEGARESGAGAEYILSVLENQLAILAGETLQTAEKERLRNNSYH